MKGRRSSHFKIMDLTMQASHDSSQEPTGTGDSILEVCRSEDEGRHSRRSGVILCAATLLSYGFFQGFGGALEPATQRILGAACLAVGILAEVVPGAPSRRWPRVVLPFLGIPLAVGLDPVVGICFALISISGPGLSGSNRARLFFFLASGVCVGGLHELGSRMIPEVWFLTESATRGLLSVTHLFTGQELNYGPTAAGIPFLVVGLGTLSGLGIRARGRGLLAILLGGLALVGLTAVSFVVPDLLFGLLSAAIGLFPEDGLRLFGLLLRPSWMTSLQAAIAVAQPWHFSPVLCVLLSLPIVSLVHRPPWIIESPICSRRVSLVAWGVGAIIALVLVSRLWAPLQPDQAGYDRGVALFYDEPHLDTRCPTFGAYGKGSSGMFGVLPRLLDGMGFEVIDGDLGENEESLDRADLIVLVNLQRVFSDGQRDRILDRIREGASLLVLTDHTGTVAIREPVNHLLSAEGIEVNFDSAVAFEKSWQNQMTFQRHPVTAGLTRSDEAQIWIGGSLSIRRPAFPVVLGRYSFADIGDVMNSDRNFLGDLAPNPGERIGDVPLVAGLELGEGRVLVFGDTSPFQNVACSLATPFVLQSLNWLSKRTDEEPEKVRFTFLLLGLLFLVFVPWTLSRPILLGAGLLLFASPLGLQSIPSARISSIDLPVALVDASHGERACLDTSQDESLGAVVRCLLRSGFFPVVTRRFEASDLEGARLVVLMAPTRPPSTKRVEEMVAFVREGGTLLLTCNAADQFAVKPFLDVVGVEIGDVPLGGPVVGREEYSVQFHDAYPLKGEGTALEPLARIEDYVLAGAVEVGKGRFVIVGDSEIFLNQNLETMDLVVEGNVFFLRDLVTGSLEP